MRAVGACKGGAVRPESCGRSGLDCAPRRGSLFAAAGPGGTPPVYVYIHIQIHIIYI